MPWRRACQLTPVFLPGEFHRQRSLVGYNPWWGCKESDITEWLSSSTDEQNRGEETEWSAGKENIFESDKGSEGRQEQRKTGG